MTNPIVLIDFSSIAHPIWHTTANEMDPNAMSTAIVAKVRALASGQPNVAICLDSRKSFRKALDATYKAAREGKPEAFYHQCRLALETLKGDGFPCWEAEGFEADDVIASAVFASCKSEAEIPNVLIVSADKDLLQLVDSATTVKNAITGNLADRATVIEKFGVDPTQICDWLTIVGDASDGVVGVKGIGAKGASALLNTFGNLDDLYAALDKGEASIKPAQLLALNEFRPRLPVVRQLLALRTDAPIPFDQILAPRMAADAAVFGAEDDSMSDLEYDASETRDDISEAMPTRKPTVTPAARTELRQAVEAINNATPTPNVEANQQPVNPITNPAPTKEDAIPARVRAAQQEAQAQESQALAVRSAEAQPPVEWERQLEPRSMGQAVQLANLMFQARLFSAYGAPQGVLSTILAGRELGIQSMASLRAFHIIEGQPRLAADTLRAIVLKSGAAKFFRVVERTAESATFETQRGDDPPVKLTYAVAEALAAFGGDEKKFKASGWGKNPADMCVARASSKLARLVYPDVVHGLYAREEFDV